MAENTIYRTSFLGSGISYLDGIPFRIGPRFIPPRKILLPPELEYNYSIRPKDPDYSFEVEEAVLRWSQERERQAQVREAQHQTEEEEEEEEAVNVSETEIECPYQNTVINSAHSTASDDVQEENIYENLPTRNGNRSSVSDHHNNSCPPKSKPNPFRIPSANTVVNNPFLVNMSDNVLQPTRIDCQKTEQSPEQKSTSSIDVTQFEKEDDPFDNVMLKTIDVMAELKTVLQSSHPSASDKGTNAPTESVERNGPTNYVNDKILNANHPVPGAIKPKPKTRKKKKHPVYVNMDYNPASNKYDESLSDNPTSLEIDSSPLEISKLPPIPKSRGNVSRHSQLPPIGSHRVGSLDNVDFLHGNLKSSNMNGSQQLYDALPQSLTISQSQQNANGGVDNPLYIDLNPKNVSCSFSAKDKHSLDTRSIPNLSEAMVDGPANISVVQSLRGKSPPLAQFPPDRPSSQQTWNRYSPLPPPLPKVSPTLKTFCSDSDKVNMVELSPYNSLSKEAKTVADKIISMGFSHPRVVRAIEKCGHDEKQVVDFLFAVDKLAEMGYDMYQAENALLIHQHNVDQSTAYLSVFKQFSLMGFSPEKIKEALVKNNNDQDKALDFLTK